MVAGRYLLKFFAFCIAILSVNVLHAIDAFPGAEGFGRDAEGGRGGKVYIVTNLDDSGPGSFRDAVSKSNRTVVFAVSGVINIKSRIVVSDHITIAGQTAPGVGVCVYGNGLSFSSADHSIVRYMRFRMGANGSKGKDAVGIAKGSPMIFDHVSVSWGRDENFSISGEDGFYTIQNSIISQGLHSHSCGGLIQNWGGVSILCCLYIDNHTRNPKVKGNNQFVNNVIYNWRVAGYILGGGSSAESNANVVGNYFISGPNTGNTPAFTRANENFKLFAENNYYDSNRNGLLDGSIIPRSVYGPVTWQDQRFDFPEISCIFSPDTAYKIVVSQAGASQPGRDPVDSFLIRELTSLGSEGNIISGEDQIPTKGPGIIKQVTGPDDTDKDGMPDFWEKAVKGLDFEKPDNNGDINNNGYTNLEDYINWMAISHLVVKKGESAQINLKDYTQGFGENAEYSIMSQLPGVMLLDDKHTIRFDSSGRQPGIYTLDYAVSDDTNKLFPGMINVLVTAE